ncbi:MAG: UPF0489 family protein [Candidatus Gracilibacteria bacterium]|jgi:hypothetical protein
MYQKPFLITKPVSNNAFNFDKRPNPQIYVPAIKEGAINDVKLGNEIVFEDFDDQEKLNSCKGLENFIKTFVSGSSLNSEDIPARTKCLFPPPTERAPIYIFDNHNHAFYFWLEGRKEGFLQDGATLIHVDQHKDNRIPESFLTKEDSTNLEKVFTYTNTVLNVGNFIPAAEHIGLIKEIIFVNSETSLLELAQKINSAFQNPAPNMILDIDLDYFAPEFDYIDNKLKVEVLRRLVPQASLITVATSPFFIDQTLALKYLHQIFD